MKVRYGGKATKETVTIKEKLNKPVEAESEIKSTAKKTAKKKEIIKKEEEVKENG